MPRTASLLAVLLGSLPTASALADDATTGRKYALLVGVSDYKASAELRSLPGAANDVTKLRKVLIDGGFKPEDVILLTSDGAADQKPNGKNINAALETVLGKCTAPDDTLILAFAGHGLQFADQSEQFFCPYDAVWNDRKTLVPLLKVFEKMGQCPSKQKVLLVDACRNDPLAETDGREANAKSLAKKTKFVIPDVKDTAALFSCNEGQTSYEDRRLNHGVFFHHVILGLAGEAAAGDETVTFDELNSYVRKSVKDYVKTNFDADQEPRLVGEIGVFNLVQPNARSVTEVQRLHRNALLAAEKKDYDTAIELYDQIIKKDPKNAEAFYLRGVQKSSLAKNARDAADVAKESAKAAIKNEDTAAAKKQDKIVADQSAVAQQYYEAAALDFGKALRHKPGYVEAYLGKADANYELGSYAAVLQDYAEALEDIPDDPKTLRARGFVYYVRGENNPSYYSKALKDLNRAIEIEEVVSPVAYYYRALVRMQLAEIEDTPENKKAKREQAMADLNRALTTDTLNSSFSRKKAELARLLDDTTAVDKEAERLSKIAETYTAKTDYKAQDQIINANMVNGNYFEKKGDTARADKTFGRTENQQQSLSQRMADQKKANEEQVSQIRAKWRGDQRDPANDATARREQRTLDMAERENQRMGLMKQKTLDRLQSQADDARSSGNDRRAAALERQYRNQLPPNMRKQYDMDSDARRPGTQNRQDDRQPGGLMRRQQQDADERQPGGFMRRQQQDADDASTRGGIGRRQQMQQDDAPARGARNQPPAERPSRFEGRQQQQQSQPPAGGRFGGGGTSGGGGGLRGGGGGGLRGGRQ